MIEGFELFYIGVIVGGLVSYFLLRSVLNKFANLLIQTIEAQTETEK